MHKKITPQPIESQEWMPIHPAPPKINRQPPVRLRTSKIDRRSIVLGLLFILPIPIFLTSLAMGSVSIPLGDVGTYSTIIAACLGAGIVTGLVIIVARRVQSSTSLLVLGLLFGYGTGAMVDLLLYFSTAEPVKSYLNWTTGSFGGVTWEQLPMMSIGILSGLILAILVAPSLNPLLLGENQAQSLGISIDRLRLLLGSSFINSGISPHESIIINC